jgi:hypothetical protein
MYNQHRDVGLNVIAIGAIKLSRGLVLENLLISYFKRPAKQYDTLLQMGRWFGYRPNYLDLSRLFIDEILLDRLEKSAWASERLKKDFEVMARSDGTPRDWGHRVRTYPEVEQLIPTSKNKMLSATIYDLSFEGLKKQTTRWQINNDVPKKNLDSFEKLLKIIDINKIVENEKIKKKDNYYLWRDVDTLFMKEFLNDKWLNFPGANKDIPPAYIQLDHVYGLTGVRTETTGLNIISSPELKECFNLTECVIECFIYLKRVWWTHQLSLEYPQVPLLPHAWR